MQLALFVQVADVTAVYDPITTHGYVAPWRVDAPGGPAWFGTLAEVERWAGERKGKKR
jgi:hypothetical protein